MHNAQVVSFCPHIYLLISHSSIHIIPSSLFLIMALCISISRALYRLFLIILKFPHPYPLASAASTNRFYSPSRWCIHIYNLCVQVTFTTQERHQLVPTSLHPSWFIIILLPFVQALSKSSSVLATMMMTRSFAGTG